MPLSRLNRFKRNRLDDTSPFQIGLVFPAGLFGFEHYIRYWLIGHQKEVPFLRVEAQENSTFFFYAIDPFLGCPDYTPSLNRQDLQEMGVVNEANLIMLALVNVNERPFTMNLAAPLIIHWPKKLGKQLLMNDNPEFPLTLCL